MSVNYSENCQLIIPGPNYTIHSIGLQPMNGTNDFIISQSEFFKDMKNFLLNSLDYYNKLNFKDELLKKDLEKLIIPYALAGKGFVLINKGLKREINVVVSVYGEKDKTLYARIESLSEIQKLIDWAIESFNKERSVSREKPYNSSTSQEKPKSR